MPFKAMLLEMLGHAKPDIVIIVAEITTKVLLANWLCDPALIAHLVLIYFNIIIVCSVTENLEEENDIYGNGAKLRLGGQAGEMSRAVAAVVGHLLPNIQHVESQQK